MQQITTTFCIAFLVASKKWQQTGFKNVKNGIIWQKVLKQIETLHKQGISIKIEWVKGHSDNVFNQKADKIAVSARKSQSYIQEV